MEKRLQKQYLGFLNTPPLWRHELLGLKQFQHPPKDPVFTGREIPQRHLKENELILGKKAESFFEAAVKHSLNYNLLAANVQVHQEKITLGEMDFLLKDKYRGQFLHVELVFKYYVYDPSFDEELARWIGPNRKDTFLQKLSRLKEKQLPLLFKPETLPFLSNLALNPEELQQEVYFKASLFVPKQLQQKQFPIIEESCIAGYWIHFSEFSKEEYGASEFYTPKKKDWPISPEHGEEWYAFSEIQKEIQRHLEQKRSPLVWRKNEKNYERFFVVWW